MRGSTVQRVFAWSRNVLLLAAVCLFLPLEVSMKKSDKNKFSRNFPEFVISTVCHHFIKTF